MNIADHIEALTTLRNDLERQLDRPTWMELAECRGLDAELFYPTSALPAPHRPGSERLSRRATAICRRCEVQAECLTYAINNEERFGIWGGVTPRDRMTLERKANR
jgi:WhiB family redox-sensing transcriptional regulator